MTDNIIQTDERQLEKADKKKQLLFDMEYEIHRTIDLLGMLSDAVLNYCETMEEVKAQAAFYGMHTALSDRRDALKSLSDRF